MSTHLSIHLPDEAATARLGAALAACIAPGMRIYLSGQLGSGKTTLVRGLIRALGYREKVKSPTYALVEVYSFSGLNLHHFDFYRFENPQEWSDAGMAEYFDDSNACVVEWPEKAGALLPPPDLELSLALDGNGRALDVRAHGAAGERCLVKLREFPSSIPANPPC